MIAYILSTVREDKKREWRTKLFPAIVDPVKLNLPNVLARMFDCAPVFFTKDDAVSYVKDFAKRCMIKNYNIVHLKRDFIMFSMSDMEDNVNPFVHQCGDCGQYPTVFYNPANQVWSIRCTNAACLNGCLTDGNKMYLTVNAWNKEQQKRQYLTWSRADDVHQKD